MAQEIMQANDEKGLHNDEYLYAVFSLIKRRDNIIVSDIETHFGSTELRMLFEILTAQHEGKRLISTQLAKLLGVTRSAVSQIVNRLEKEGVVKRVADDVDRKIAYIELTEKTLAEYQEDLNKCKDFINRVVARFGEENFYQMVKLFNDFIEKINQEKKASSCLRNRK